MYSNVRFTRNAIRRTAFELFVTLGNEPSVYFLKKQKNIKILSKFKNIDRWDLCALHLDPEGCKVTIRELKDSTDWIDIKNLTLNTFSKVISDTKVQFSFGC